VAWEVLENQSLYLEGKEGDLFSMILGVRYCNKITVSAIKNQEHISASQFSNRCSKGRTP